MTILQLFYDFTNKLRPRTNANQNMTGKTVLENHDSEVETKTLNELEKKIHFLY